MSYTIINQINAWKKCSYVEHICWNYSKWRNTFLWKTFFAWKNYLGQPTEAIVWGRGNYLEGNYLWVIIRGTIIQAPIVREQLFWGPLSGGIYPGAIALEHSMVYRDNKNFQKRILFVNIFGYYIWYIFRYTYCFFKFFDTFHVFFNPYMKVKCLKISLARVSKFIKNISDTELLHPFYSYLDH